MARDPEPRKRRQLIALGEASTPSVAVFFQVDQEKKARACRAKVRAIDHRVRGKKAQKAERDKDKKEAVEGKRKSPPEPVEEAKKVLKRTNWSKSTIIKDDAHDYYASIERAKARNEKEKEKARLKLAASDGGPKAGENDKTVKPPMPKKDGKDKALSIAECDVKWKIPYHTFTKYIHSADKKRRAPGCAPGRNSNVFDTAHHPY